MWPHFPEVTRCSGCRTVFWLHQTVDVGRIELSLCFAKLNAELGGTATEATEPESWRNAEPIIPLSERDCYQALSERAFSDRSEEIHLRTMAWHLGNRRCRGQLETDSDDRAVAKACQRHERKRSRAPQVWLNQHPPSVRRDTSNLDILTSRADNLKQLAALINDTPGERLMKAEILRELEMFADAIELLTTPFPPQYYVMVSVISTYAAQGDSAMHEVTDLVHKAEIEQVLGSKRIVLMIVRQKIASAIRNAVKWARRGLR
jgi:hypothetical protein